MPKTPYSSNRVKSTNMVAGKSDRKSRKLNHILRHKHDVEKTHREALQSQNLSQ